MNGQSLLRSQEAEVFQIVEATGFDPREFEWTYMARGGGPGAAPTLQHLSGGYFQFHHDGDRHYGHCSPGLETHEQDYYSRFGSWEELREGVYNWLGWLKRELSAPDFWAQLEVERELVASPPDATNTAFTDEERAEIATRLGELKRTPVRPSS